MSDEPADTAARGPARTSAEDPQNSSPDTREPVAEEPQARLYHQVAQSVATVVEDTGEQLRRLAALSTSASGVALRLMLSGEKPKEASQAMAQAEQSMQQATALFQEISRVSVQLLERFQPPPPRATSTAKVPVHEETGAASSSGQGPDQPIPGGRP